MEAKDFNQLVAMYNSGLKEYQSRKEKWEELQPLVRAGIFEVVEYLNSNIKQENDIQFETTEGGMTIQKKNREFSEFGKFEIGGTISFTTTESYYGRVYVFNCDLVETDERKTHYRRTDKTFEFDPSTISKDDIMKYIYFGIDMVLKSSVEISKMK